MKIKDLANKYKISSDELVALLRNAGYNVSADDSEIDYDMLAALDRHFSRADTGTRKTRSKKAKSKSGTAAKAKAKSRARATTGKKAGTKAAATRTSAKSKAKSKTKSSSRSASATKSVARTKTKSRARGKSRTTAATVADTIVELAEAEACAKARVRAKTKLVRKRKPEPKPETVIAEDTASAGSSSAQPSVPDVAVAPAVEVPDSVTPAPSDVGAASGAPNHAPAEPVTRPAGEAGAPAAAAKPKAKDAPKATTVHPAPKGGPQQAPAALPKDTPRPRPKAGPRSREPVVGAEPRKGRRRDRKTPGEREAQQRAVRESVRRTLAKMETSPRKSKRKKSRTAVVAEVDLQPVQLQEKSTLAMLAAAIHHDTAELLAQCEELGLDVTETTELDRDTLAVLAESVGREVEIEAAYGETRLLEEARIAPDRLVPRPPVVTVMGHVDHGKTSILDYIRHARVAQGEAGGITQHIGAYEVDTPEGRITFVDTPGHEAFTAMRARGAQITDIVVLVVAADDGVMPQTVEAINHTRAAGVPLVLAVNKIDLPGANPMNVKQQLMQRDVMVESYGGDVVDVDLSAKTGEGIDRLLEMILLQAELLELKADPGARPQGVVLETQKEEGRGILVTLLVQQGTLKVGDVLVLGSEHAKVRSLVDFNGKRVKSAGPSDPVQLLGADGLPEPGDRFVAVKNEREAREVSQKRKDAVKVRQQQPRKALTLEDLYAQFQTGQLKELSIIIKGDVNGSVEALRESLEPLEIEDIKVKVLHAAVGVVTETDVLFAQGSNGIIIAFGTAVSPKARELARRRGVDIRAYSVIYEVIEDVQNAMKGLLEPVFVERVLGRAEIRQLFRVSRLGTIAGSMVVEGSILRNANARVMREGEALYDGKITSLKRFKDDVREVTENFECGIGVGYDELEEGDIIEAYVVEEKARVV